MNQGFTQKTWKGWWHSFWPGRGPGKLPVPPKNFLEQSRMSRWLSQNHENSGLEQSRMSRWLSQNHENSGGTGVLIPSCHHRSNY
jgi:hypothetical protein